MCTGPAAAACSTPPRQLLCTPCVTLLQGGRGPDHGNSTVRLADHDSVLCRLCETLTGR
jgi:hypothetical protein